MHVAIDGRLIGYGWGGIARYTFELCNALLDLEEFGPTDRLTLLTRRAGSLGVARRPNPRLRSGRLFTPPHHRLEQLSLPLEVARLRPNLLHSPDFIPPFRRSFRSVITVHDLGFLRFPEALTADSRRYYGRIGKAVRSAERTIAVSQHTARDLIELVGAPADRIRVIYNGVGEAFRPLDDVASLSETRVRYGLDQPYVLSVGTLEPRKNLGTLLRAVKIVRERHNLLLVLVGRRGWLFEPIFELIDQLTLGQHVRLLETVPDADLPAIYRAATAFATPSLYEGFGLSSLEALACGVPTVVADTSSLPELVGDAALLHPPTDHAGLAAALLRLLEDDALRATLRQRGLERAARFTWAETARQTLAVYREALGGQSNDVLRAARSPWYPHLP